MTDTIKTAKTGFQELAKLDWDDELKSSNVRDYIRTLKPVDVNELPPIVGEIQFWLTLDNGDLIVLNVREFGEGRSRIAYTSRVPCDKSDPKNKPIGFAPQKEYDVLSTKTLYFDNRCSKTILKSLRS